MSVRKDGKIIAGTTVNPDLFDFKWADHILDDASWLRADTFSWQSGLVYEAAYNHLVADLNVLPAIVVTDGETYPIYTRYASGDVSGALHPYCWKHSTEGNVYTTQEDPPVGNNKYAFTTATGSVVAGYIYSKGTRPGAQQQTETIAGTTITYYLAADKHKIVLPNQESNIASIYAATGVAWYYILDTTNQRFKLPRSKHEHYGDRPVVGNGMTLGFTNGTNNVGIISNATWSNTGLFTEGAYNKAVGTTPTGTNPKAGDFGVTTDPDKSGIISKPVQDTDQYKYLYFYVGNFTQTALENTAGITAETLNNKVDKGHQVIEFQAPTAENNYTWYRLYADGWVEQGGLATSSNAGTTCNFPVAMADNKYTAQVTVVDDGASNYSTAVKGRNTTRINITTYTETRPCSWFVCGMAA